jgi:hypothetical protein
LNKKGISTWLIVAIIVVVVVIGGIAVYVLYSGGGGEEEITPTPTPTPNADVESATSLAFKVNGTIGGVNELYAFTAKNLGTSDILMRTDEFDVEGNAFIYQFNQTAQTVWASYSGQWSDVSSEWTSYWDGANSGVVGYTAFEEYKTQLATNWSGSGDYDYSSSGDTFHIYDIVINPSIEDSLFAHG